MTTPRPRIRYRWPDICAALLTCAAAVAFPIIVLTLAESVR
jgi:hypothetical protein